ncbi:MAG: YgiQ family radical SAM protein [Bacteroidetes bacterium]|nr:MAG: YgiQ family radical SAM protein [Bacteroidota bacterium]
MRENYLNKWLPTTVKDAKLRGWTEMDVILFTGDAYVDHPAFGAAVIGRILESMGLKVAIVPQPNWQDDLRDFKKFGKPKLFFAVTAGNMDSMVNHYTANKRLRSNDAYTPDGKKAHRPDYASVVYSNILKKLFPDVPIVLGGVEASLRRLTHYDYWSDKLKPGILIETKADILVYGMGEKPIKEIVNRIKEGKTIAELTNIPQTAYLQTNKEIENIDNKIVIKLSSHEECLKDKLKFAKNFKIIETESNRLNADIITQKVGKETIVVNPPFPVMEQKELDSMYDLPFTRLPHPKYDKKGPIPAYEMIKFSINIHRGCFGGCSFCTISAHQGKFVQSRSEASVLREVKMLAKMLDFKGNISDLGGPSANMYQMQGVDLSICESCKRPSCISPAICTNLSTDHTKLTALYQKANRVEGIKKVFIGSGIRYDMLFDKNQKLTPDGKKYTENLVENHVSGRLKIAPEHTSDEVLKMMRKPTFELFKKFQKHFFDINKKLGLKQQLIPYFISSHPGSQMEDMADLAIQTKKLNFQLEQVQDFTPTPMTVATVIYYSGYHPYTLKKVFTARTKENKLNQRMFFFWYKWEFRKQIENGLKKIGRIDLIKELLEIKPKGKKVDKNEKAKDKRKKTRGGKRR